MKITREITRTITDEEIEDILCNKCGESCFDKHEMNFEGLIEAYLCGGFGSKIGDGVAVEFSLCETCLLELFDRCVIKPKFTDTLWGDDLEEIAMENSDEEEETKTEESP